MNELLIKLSQSKWFSRKLLATAGVDITFIQQLLTTSDPDMQKLYVVGTTIVTSCYTLAVAIENVWKMLTAAKK